MFSLVVLACSEVEPGGSHNGLIGAGFILLYRAWQVLGGVLLPWPTLLTLVMFPVLA